MNMEAEDFAYAKSEIHKLVGIDLNHYKSQQVQRRLNTYLLRSGFPDWRSFFRAVRGDKTASRKLRDYLTINVSSFFRDPEKFNYLRDNIFPELLNVQTPLRVWSAGCSFGQEAYSIAMVLSEIIGIPHPHSVLATDLDQSAIEVAHTGGPYSAQDVANVPHPLNRNADPLERVGPEHFFDARLDGFDDAVSRCRGGIPAAALCRIGARDILGCLP